MNPDLEINKLRKEKNAPIIVYSYKNQKIQDITYFFENSLETIKLNTLKKVYFCLKNELRKVRINEDIRKAALMHIRRILKIKKKSGL